MKKIWISILLFSFIHQNKAQQLMYSPAWFGPNANPVPEFTDARIPAKTTISLMGDYYFGYGDKTKNGYFKIEFPLIKERVSFKIWSTILEHYNLSSAVAIQRGIINGSTSGKANGDIYVQTRIRLLNEKNNCPSIILNSTLKSASGTNHTEARYFDTPGYYFDAEIGKSFYTKSKFINEIRGVANIGFMCWETERQSTQDDAPMYGAKIIIGNQHWKWDNSISGYYGWIHTSIASGMPNFGDTPLVTATKLSFQKGNINYFAQYQYGINDFPYHQLRAGISFTIDKLTPKMTKTTPNP